MEIVSNSPEKIVLKIDVSYSLANAIRRSVEETLTLAIDEIEFFKNDSALYDEYLAHRLGLVPLKMDGKMGPKTSVELKLKKSGPCTVYSGDLIGSVKAAYKNMPLTILEKGQELELVATAKLSNGLEHAKYVPGLANYRNILEVKSSSQIDGIIQESKGAIKAEKKGNKWLCDLNETTIDEIRALDKDSINETNELLFFVESFGQMDAKTILIKAVECLEDNLEEFTKKIK